VMKEKDPNCLPLTMFWGIDWVLNFMDPTWQFHHATGASNIYYDWDSKKYESAAQSPKFQAELAYLNKLYAEGLMDPEIFTNDLDQWTQKVVTGKSLVTFCWSDQLDSINSAGKKTNPDFDLENVLPLSVDNSKQTFVQEAGHVQLGWGVPATETKKPIFNDLLKFLDWFFYSPEGTLLENWGVEGVSYVVKDGANTFTDELLKAPNGATKQHQISFGLNNDNFSSFVTKDRDMAYIGPKAADITQKMIDAKMFISTPPVAKLSVDDSEQVSLLSAPIKDYVDKSIQSFIQGKTDPTKDWDSYSQQVEAKNIKSILDIYNNALAAQK
jgi:putative aldouronate transport system substrate-binding protein